MSVESTLLSLIQMDDGKIVSILRSAIKIYGRILYAVANDIYDSCIEDYYNGYTPKYYKRHGNIEGFNLYSARGNSLTGNRLIIDTNAGKLMPYKGNTRDEVLFNVLNGLRGTGMRASQEEWPMNWDTSYPNSYSSYKFWYSSGHTIEDIMQDFADNVLDDTEDVFWECVAQLI
jgi:hypothetical protein